MRSTVTRDPVAKISADQSTLDRALKHLRKLRWIGQEIEVKQILPVKDDAALRPTGADANAAAGRRARQPRSAKPPAGGSRERTVERPLSIIEPLCK
jgi:hypothetical protein